MRLTLLMPSDPVDRHRLPRSPRALSADRTLGIAWLWQGGAEQDRQAFVEFIGNMLCIFSMHLLVSNHKYLCGMNWGDLVCAETRRM